MNPSGARKLTDYLGEYIQQNYNISDHRGEERYARWFEDYEVYRDYKTTKSVRQTELDNYLMMLADRGLDVCVYMKEESKILQKEVMRNLVGNLTLQGEKPKLLERAVSKGKEYLLIVDHDSGTNFETTDLSEGGFFDMNSGGVYFGREEGGSPFLSIGEDPTNYLVEDVDLQVIVRNRYTGEVINVTGWNDSASGIKRVRYKVWK